MFKKLNQKMITRAIQTLERAETGQGSAEFGTILAGLLVAVLIVIAIFRDALIDLFQRVASLMR